ncbi:LOW QUALITY PROTEIN: kinesin-like protein KIF14 [Macrobrachium rosenbergii]|uniref:LOW QUALITY PROTEIN: kinesin-like protein KIF14 n=1 Tax=Macrobrachium rosenbergii TaxID=79674 RepID=UPI0034D3F577
MLRSILCYQGIPPYCRIMNNHKTEVKIVVTSSEVKDGRGKPVNMTGIKHFVQKVTSTTRGNESESSHIMRTPSCRTVAPTTHTPLSTPRTTCGLSVTPKSSDHASDNVTVTPQHTTPTFASRTGTPKSLRTPLPTGSTRTPATNPPRLGPPVVPVPKKLKKDESHKPEFFSRSEGHRRTKTIKSLGSDRKEEEKKRKEHAGVRRVLSSSTVNVPAPLRLSGECLSFEAKSPLPSRTSLGRPSSASKASVGLSTPTLELRRRSSVKLSKSSKLFYDNIQTPTGCSALTPDVIRSCNTDVSVSPSAENYVGRAESTAVSVGVRVRPLNSREQTASELNILDVFGNTLKIQSDTGSSYTFKYDHCFWSCSENHPQYASQEDVYATIAQPLLEKAYEGYNVCLFAYGQTGSGKSYTMLGDGTLDEPDMPTLHQWASYLGFAGNCLTVPSTFTLGIHPKISCPCLVEIEISYFEIYNERIYDLLSAGGGNRCSAGDHREALRVREHPENGPYVEGVACHLVSSYDDLQTWLLLGNKERSIAATGMNDKSSRSHAVFTIKLTQTVVEDVEGEQLESSKVSVINLVDLAGSERLAASQSQGDRLKEGVCINKSLLTLGKVITALAESAGRRRTFIPYRESVLTYLLKESLGGNSRTAMIATISPCKSHLDESLSTLRYAQQARKIVNHNYVNEDPTAMLIRSLKEEVERLRRQQLLKSPSMLFDSELVECGNKSETEEGVDEEKEKALLEKENKIREKEQEKNQAIKEKEAEIALLREQLRSQQLLSERNRNLEQRLRENEACQQEVLQYQLLQGISGKGDKGPQLVNLCEDPQLSETLSYNLKDGVTTIGQSPCDLILRGLHGEDIHCTIVKDGEKLTLHPRIDTETYVNGQLIMSPVQVKHGDRVVLAGIYYFRLNDPKPGMNSEEKTLGSMDFFTSQEELLREQEKRLREEADKVLAASKAELEMEMCLQRDKLLQDIYEASSKLKNKEQLVFELEDKQWKLEEEKRLLEEELHRKEEMTHSLDLSLCSPQLPKSNILHEVEAVFNESVVEVHRDGPFYAPPRIAFMIKEANRITKKLKKPYEFMVQEMFTESGVEMIVLLKDLRHQTTAKLPVSTFIQKVNILRDIVQGEESEDMLESTLVWERTEDLNCVPGFLNKLQDCVSSSLNCSLSGPTPLGSRCSSKRRRSSINYNFEKNSSMSTIESMGGSVAVATAIHSALATLSPPVISSHPLQSTLNSIGDLHSSVQIIRNHTSEPRSTLSEEEFNKQLIVLLCTSQVTLQNLSSSGHMEPDTSCNSCIELQEKFREADVKITNCTSRIFQGVKNEVASLVEEECLRLSSLCESLVLDIGKLAIMSTLPVPETSKLKPGGPLCVNYTEGVRCGLESLLLKSVDSAMHSAIILSNCKSCAGSSKVIEAAESAMQNIALFLKKFVKLNAAVEYGKEITEDDQKDIIVEWVFKAESASDTIIHLQKSLVDIGGHIEMPQALNSEMWRRLAEELKGRLEKLLCFAGIGVTSFDITYCSLSSSLDSEDSAMFMEELQNIAKISLQSVETLIDTVSKISSPYFDEQVSQNMQKTFFGHWPKNCNEYKMFLEDQKTKQLCQSPRKSSLRTIVTPREEKKVRFDVEYDSASESYVENVDTINI